MQNRENADQGAPVVARIVLKVNSLRNEQQPIVHVHRHMIHMHFLQSETQPASASNDNAIPEQ